MTIPGFSPLVTLHGVHKVFPNGVTAVRDLDIEVRDGEFVTLLGPSGCGKSTALRMIAGLTEPTSGKIKWRETVAPGEIGFVFQDPTLMPWADVTRNVALPFRLRHEGGDDPAERIRDILERVGLSQFAHVYPRELSGGMKMRVSIARALVTDPKLLLMDEPFAALDEITRFRLNNDLLKVWQARGGTVVFVTHSVFESVFLSSRIVVMTARPGRVHAELSIEEPYPRDEAFRTSAEYAGYCRRVSQALSDAMAGAAE